MRQDLFFSLKFLAVVFVDAALPALVFGVAGKYLDRYFGTGHMLLVVAMAIAMLVTFFLLTRAAKSAIKKMEDK